MRIVVWFQNNGFVFVYRLSRDLKRLPTFFFALVHTATSSRLPCSQRFEYLQKSFLTHGLLCRTRFTLTRRGWRTTLVFWWFNTDHHCIVRTFQIQCYLTRHWCARDNFSTAVRFYNIQKGRSVNKLIFQHKRHPEILAKEIINDFMLLL